jgi:flagellar motor switch/type III secretory pathway protein FliN
LLASGEAVAKGEVVIIDENFGIRVTNLLSASPRE